MVHIKRLSSGTPKQGNAWQEFMCAFAVAINALLSAMGGSSPVFVFVEDKCDIPQPNDTSS
ncbi:MAG TPA: hypothetical protein PLI09_18130 [Candidatus Hydrogenedentes bacterium]|nr:hypothetical protein [Candidatus Hydrogenedentota bacterium]